MSEPKTQPAETPIEDSLAALEPPRRPQTRRRVERMSATSGADPVLWGSRVVGVGVGHWACVYASGCAWAGSSRR